MQPTTHYQTVGVGLCHRRSRKCDWLGCASKFSRRLTIAAAVFRQLAMVSLLTLLLLLLLLLLVDFRPVFPSFGRFHVCSIVPWLCEWTAYAGSPLSIIPRGTVQDSRLRPGLIGSNELSCCALRQSYHLFNVLINMRLISHLGVTIDTVSYVFDISVTQYLRHTALSTICLRFSAIPSCVPSSLFLSILNYYHTLFSS